MDSYARSSTQGDQTGKLLCSTRNMRVRKREAILQRVGIFEFVNTHDTFQLHSMSRPRDSTDIKDEQPAKRPRTERFGGWISNFVFGKVASPTSADDSLPNPADAFFGSTVNS